MTPQEITRKRLRQYGEPIASTPKLREALTDDQANELIDWGMAALQRWVEETVDQSDGEVTQLLDNKATAVSLIMTLVNQLMAQPGKHENEDIVNDRAVRLGKNLYWLTGNNNRKAYRLAYAEYESVRNTADSDDLFKHIMAIIYAYKEES
ncbi:MAG: hypothetical protein AAF490_02110 [Chloroflexota bacterium]